ncbi:MAG: hypothetical protein WDN46_19550 [Methylocella sp.]
MTSAELRLHCYWTLMAEIREAAYAGDSHTRFCVRNELRDLFEGPPGLIADPRLAKLCRAAFGATFVLEFGTDGAAAGRAEHERLDAEHHAAMQSRTAENGRAYKAWRAQFALIDKRRALAA